MVITVDGKQILEPGMTGWRISALEIRQITVREILITRNRAEYLVTVDHASHWVDMENVFSTREEALARLNAMEEATQC